MNKETHNSPIEPELQGRIVALVLGEASDFETEVLHQLIEQRPELAAFKQEMQSVHELLGKVPLQDVGAGDFEAPDENWKLPADRRNAVLAAIRGEATALAVTAPAVDRVVQKQSVTYQPEAPARNEQTASLARRVRVLLADSLRPFASSVSRRMRWTPARIAAGICVAGFIGLMTVPSFFSREFMLADRSSQRGLAEDSIASKGIFRGRYSISGGTDLSYQLAPEVASAPDVAGVVVEEQFITKLDSDSVNYAPDSSTALSALQQTLNAGALASNGTDGVNTPRSIAAGRFRSDLPDRASVVPGAVNAPTSSAGTAISGGVEESMPQLMWETEMESVGKTTLDLTMTESLGRLQDQQQKQGEQPLSKSKDSLGLSGDASDFGSMERSLNELSDETSDGVGGSALGLPGAGGQPGISGGGFEGRGGVEPGDMGPGQPGQPSRDSYFDMPVDAKGDAGEISKALADVDFTAPQEPSGLESRLFGRSDVTPRGTEGIDLKKNAGGQGGDMVLGHPFQVDQLDNLQSLARSESEVAAQPERDSGVDGSNGIADVARKTREKEQSEEWRRKAGDPDSGVRGRTHSFFRRGEAARPALDGDLEVSKRLVAKAAAPSVGLNETTAAAEAFSTFSLHVSDVSFKLAAAALARGEWPEAAKIRIEEFVNAFDYSDPLPGKGEKVACVVEQSIHPFVQQRNVLRVSMRTAAEGRATNTPLRLTFVLDNSGSMERIDRRQTVRRALTLLSQQLSAIDQVTLISFARQPRLMAENVSGTESGKLVELIEQLPSEGGTNIESALQLAFEKAAAQQTPGAQNRIILLTDGAVNLGNADPESLSQMVTSMRDSGIAFDAAGISAEGLNDEVLEALTRQGDGRYYLLDSGEDADDRFAQQIAGALRPTASNVKVQVEFNPKRVGQYKLLGFEKHLLKQEDFRNDAVDAAEMAAAEAGVALYQFEARPDGEGDVGSVSVRFRDLSTGQMVEHRWPIPYEAEAARPDQASPSLRIATSAAMLAAKLRGEALGESVDLQTLSHLISGLPAQDQSSTRVQQLKLMIEQARQMSQK